MIKKNFFFYKPFLKLFFFINVILLIFIFWFITPKECLNKNFLNLIKNFGYVVINSFYTEVLQVIYYFFSFYSYRKLQ